MNLATILIGLLVAAAFIAIVARGIYNRKNHKGGCACGGDCAHCGACKQ